MATLSLVAYQMVQQVSRKHDSSKVWTRRSSELKPTVYTKLKDFAAGVLTGFSEAKVPRPSPPTHIQQAKIRQVENPRFHPPDEMRS